MESRRQDSSSPASVKHYLIQKLDCSGRILRSGGVTIRPTPSTGYTPSDDREPAPYDRGDHPLDLQSSLEKKEEV